MTCNANEVYLMRCMRAVGEHNFQSEGNRCNANMTLSLGYMASMCKGPRAVLCPSLRSVDAPRN